MTEQEIHEEQEVEVPVSYLPEAGGVAFLELWGTVTDSATERREAFKINITARGLSPQEALDSIIDCMKYANERYHLKPYNPLAPQTPRKPVGTTPEPNVKTASAAAPAPVAKPQSPTAAVAQPAQLDNGTIRVVKVVVTPRTDGKSKVEFFAEGRRYADLSAVMTPDNLANLFGAVDEAWSPEHFQVATEYPVSFTAFWKESDKVNTAGKHYRNVVKLEA